MSFVQEYARSMPPQNTFVKSSSRSSSPGISPESKLAIEPVELLAATPVASYFRVKSIVDRCLTAVFMLAALPLLVCIAGLVWICDGRPVFYRQTRVGQGGRLFRIWKFRTMLRDAEHRTGAVWCSTDDPRVTRLGSWLRSSHLDELPQFFNVLQGDMNLIGPRPERPEFVEELARELPSYLQRIRVAPGITGLAQLRTGYDRSLADVRRKVAIDLEYVRSASLRLDLQLLAQTVVYIVCHVWQERIRAVPTAPAEVGQMSVSVARSTSVPAPHLGRLTVLPTGLPTGLPLGESCELMSPTAWSTEGVRV